MKSNSKFNKQIEKYYDSKKSSFLKKIDLSKSYYSDTYVDKSGRHILELKNDNKTILKAEYELLGFYNIANSSWYWGYATDLVDRSMVKDTIKMKEFPNYIKQNYGNFDKREAEDLYFKTNMPSFFIGIKSIEELIKTALFYLEKEWYVTVCQGRDGNAFTCKKDKEDKDKDKDKNDKNDKNDILRFEYLLIKKIFSLG